MTAVQRRARASIRRWAVNIEIELKRADRAKSDRWRQYHLHHAANYADLALRVAPSVSPQAGAV